MGFNSAFKGLRVINIWVKKNIDLQIDCKVKTLFFIVMSHKRIRAEVLQLSVLQLSVLQLSILNL